MLDQLREGDVVVVWKLDRLSRSLKDFLLILEKIEKAGAGFRSVTEHVDTTTSAGRMMMQMLGSFAEFERSMIRERTRAGLAAAKEDGRALGRPAASTTSSGARLQMLWFFRAQVGSRYGTLVWRQSGDNLADCGSQVVGGKGRC